AIKPGAHGEQIVHRDPRLAWIRMRERFDGPRQKLDDRLTGIADLSLIDRCAHQSPNEAPRRRTHLVRTVHIIAVKILLKDKLSVPPNQNAVHVRVFFSDDVTAELLQDGFGESRSSCSSSDPHSVVELHGSPRTVLRIACRARDSQSENFWRNFLRYAGK